MHRFFSRLKKRAALLAAVLCLGAASAFAMPPVFPYAELVGGESGEAYTVVDETTGMESFRVDIIGKMEGGSSRSIMARASGPLIEKTGGVLQGMSGSPVYVDGRLVGAVAAGVKEMERYTFFITPIEDMLPLWDLPDKKKSTSPKSLDLKKYAEDKEKKAKKDESQKTWTEKAIESGLITECAEKQDPPEAMPAKDKKAEEKDVDAEAEEMAKPETKEADAPPEVKDADVKAEEKTEPEGEEPAAKAEEKSEPDAKAADAKAEEKAEPEAKEADAKAEEKSEAEASTAEPAEEKAELASDQKAEPALKDGADAKSDKKESAAKAAGSETDKKEPVKPADAEKPSAGAKPIEQEAAKAEEGEPLSSLELFGFTGEARSFLLDRLGFRGQGLALGSAGGATRMSPVYDASLEAGESVGVAVVYGDFSVGATGTVTAVEGKKVLAFGHSFMRAGNVNYFMTDASVVGTVEGPTAGMKIANLGPIIGRFSQDREAGIAGTLGEFPAVVPMRVHIEDTSLARDRIYNTSIAYDESYLAEMTGAIGYAALVKTSDATSGATARVKFTIRTDAMKDGVFERENMFYNTSDVGQISFMELMRAVNVLCRDEEKEPSIIDVEADVKVEDGRKTASLISAIPEQREVYPGDTVNFKTTIRPYRGKEETFDIPYTVPETQREGKMTLDVRGGGFQPVSAMALLAQAGLEIPMEEGEEKQTTREKLEAIADADKNNEIIITPGASMEPLSEKEQKRLIREAKDKALKEAEQGTDHKVEFLAKEKDKKDMNGRLEAPYIIDNVIHSSLQIKKK